MKRHAPSADRNKNPILEVLSALLQNELPPQPLCLEIASGSGQHVAHFAAHLPHVTFLPTDQAEDARRSIEAHREERALSNILEALPLDASADEWPVQEVFAIVCINMIHISPFSATEGLFRGAARTLSPGGFLLTYGPYRFADAPFAPSNEAFDETLKSRDPSFGIRDVQDLDTLANKVGLSREATIVMPANNHCLVFRKPRS